MKALSAVTLRDTLRLYADRRLLIIFLLGVSSGFPWVLIGKGMTVWLQEAGVSRSAIGYFGSIFIVYALNFLWAPLLDRITVFGLSKLGRRRSWILFCQLLIVLGMLGLAFYNPGNGPFWVTSLIAFGIALASATQDIAIDAYRIEIIDREETDKISAGAAMATSGWWAGFGLFGGVALILADLPSFDWADVYLALIVVMLVLIAVVLCIKEPEHEALANSESALDIRALVSGRFGRQILLSLRQSVFEPLAEFFKRNGWSLALSLLGFIFLFKLGEAFLGRMAIVFYKEVGFSKTDIGIYSSLIGWWATAIFAVICSAFNARFGLVRGLFWGGLAMAATNLLFALMAVVGPDTRLFAVTIILDNFTSAWATVAFVAFISYLTSRTYTATQYALMASLGNLGKTTIAIYSGAMVDGLGGNWALFFVLTSLMVLPSLALLWWMAKRLDIR